jgi:hypothetical protein
MPDFATEPPPAPPGAYPGGRDGVQYAQLSVGTDVVVAPVLPDGRQRDGVEYATV